MKFSHSLILHFQNHAPNWFRAPLTGPAPGPHMRRPGCNGAVCYCNNEDYCNAGVTWLVECLFLCLVFCFSF